ncbi:actinidain-like [Actinidia eriantha]|uniref:actinidain-like n=1 Tax=Actinidia eriantha TaxID=165200 RepID=UPI00258A9950|nr:actinidain-like [Actinidia eriantha]
MSIITYTERTNGEVIAMFESWLVRHRKSYNALGEKERRFEIFKENLRFVDKHNADMDRSYRVGLNQFADLTSEEYPSMYLKTKISPRRMNVSDRYEPRVGDQLPDFIDWREKDRRVASKPFPLTPRLRIHVEALVFCRISRVARESVKAISALINFVPYTIGRQL